MERETLRVDDDPEDASDEQMNSDSPSEPPIVGIGASAGGLEALKEFFSRVDGAAGLSYVVVQHFDPERESMTAELLDRVTSIPVTQVNEDTRVEANHVYVIAPDTRLTLRERELRVERHPDRSGNGRSDIDIFLRSLAREEEDNAIAILLSGSGTDGTLGIKEVKGRGGLTIAQDPGTARFARMPASAIESGRVDRVLTVDRMAEELSEYVGNLRTLRRKEPEELLGEDDRYLDEILTLLRRREGHDFEAYKRNTLVRRIRRRLQVHHQELPDAYVERLREDPEEVEALFKDLLIGVTEFFRDPEAFAVLEERVIPEIFSRKEAGEEVRVWVPGCSTGEEAYSIAMLLVERIAEEPRGRKVTVFASDVDPAALDFARRGVYPEGIVDSVTPERLKRHFHEQNGHYKISPRLREMCLFAPHDVLRDPPFSRQDLISCRNLLIYLRSEAQEKLLPVFHYALRDGGYLFLGPSEKPSGRGDAFETIDEEHRVYRQRPAAGGRPLDFPLSSRDRPVRTVADPSRPLDEPEEEREGRSVGSAVERVLLATYAPAAALIDDKRDVVYIVGRTGRYLEPAAGTPTANILDLARPGLETQLRSTIHRASQSGETTVRRGVELDPDGEDARLNLTVRPVPELGTDDGMLLVIFEEAHPDAQAAEIETAAGAQAEGRIVEELESELRQTEEQLQVTIEELESSNEELKSSNEELLSMNEELQSANEELQTSQEETQSVNEELQTVNAELSEKVRELDEAHGDLRNLFMNTDVGTVFVDADLRVKRFTPASTALFRLIDEDAGRSIGDITARFEEADGLVDEIREVIRTLTPVEREVRVPAEDASFLMRIVPYRTVDDTIEGAVLTFVEITELKRSQERTEEARRFAESIVDSVPSPILVLDEDLAVLSASRSYYEKFEESPGATIGRSIFDVSRGRWDLSRLESLLESVLARETDAESFETEIELPGEGRRVLRIEARQMREERSVGQQIMVLIDDVTEWNELLRERREASARKDEFLALLGHELRNPLTPLLNAVDLLREGYDDPDRQLLAILERQLGQLVRLVDDLLDVSRITRGDLKLERQRLDLGDLVRQATEDRRGMFEEREISLSVDLPEAPTWVRGDRVRLAQVLGNLLSNANQYSDPGGRVEVTLTAPEEDTARLTVRDSGIGMREETMERLFEPFQIPGRAPGRSRGGLGLGLALVRNIVELHGGAVRAESEGEGEGSVFTVELPRVPARQPESEPEEVPEIGSRRILVVEDSPDGAEILRLTLSSRGHEVTVAEDGESALEVVGEVRPEIVICDIGLPGGMDGFDLARALREREDVEIRHLVAYSGFGQESNKRRAREAGFDVHLTKPVSVSDLEEAILGLDGG